MKSAGETDRKHQGFDSDTEATWYPSNWKSLFSGLERDDVSERPPDQGNPKHLPASNTGTR